ncbi:hypothetical protein [Nocardioides zeicaulis]|uniref:Uncharacterized protein n=1 Tax=Nocardioides zeicaulis TaxID=1776857 RepID=A0ABV6E0G3_9ACTN
MDTTLPRPVRTLLVLLVVVLLAVSIVLGAALVSGRSPGSWWAQATGHVVVEHHADAADVPDGERPDWLPADADEITVVRPGRAAGGATGTRLDARVPQGTAVPASCAASRRPALPWDGGGDWPDFTAAETLTCDGWHLVARPHHWYAWS